MGGGIFLLIFLFFVSGCGALFLASEKQFPLYSSPEAAEVWIEGRRVGITPMEFELDNKKNHLITFKKEGFDDISCRLNSSVSPGIVVLDVLAGFVPLIIDAVTGEWKRIPKDECFVTLSPKTG